MRQILLGKVLIKVYKFHIHMRIEDPVLLVKLKHCCDYFDVIKQ